MSIESLHRRAAEICVEVFAGPAVEAARLAYEERVNRVAQLKTAQGRLVREAKDLSEARRTATRQLEDTLIAARVDGRKWSPSDGLDKVGKIDAHHRLVTASNSRVLEHLLPAAEIETLELAGAQYRAQAAALREVAEDRLRKTTELMADAAEHEGSIVFDPTQTLSGILHHQAAELEIQAANHQTWALQRREEHARIVGQER